MGLDAPLNTERVQSFTIAYTQKCTHIVRVLKAIAYRFP